MTLHIPTSTSKENKTEILTDHWQVNDKYLFENIAVTHPVASADFRYLTCGACERGPLGIVFVNQPETFYIAHSRIKYTDK